MRPGRFGPRGVERRLRAAGIGAEEARQAVAEALGERSEEWSGRDEPPEVVLCRALAERRSGGTMERLADRERARLARFLLRRGFGGAVVARVVGLKEDLDIDPG
jgi:regulatory protein